MANEADRRILTKLDKIEAMVIEIDQLAEKYKEQRDALLAACEAMVYTQECGCAERATPSSFAHKSDCIVGQAQAAIKFGKGE